MISDDSSLEELIKEVYALFGLAYYHSECLHRELCHIYVLASLRDPKAMTRPRIEEKFVNAHVLTLGQVKEDIKEFIPKEFYNQLGDAVKKEIFWLTAIGLKGYI